jgi:hypothetical protein
MAHRPGAGRAGGEQATAVEELQVDAHVDALPLRLENLGERLAVLAVRGDQREFEFLAVLVYTRILFAVPATGLKFGSGSPTGF